MKIHMKKLTGMILAAVLIFSLPAVTYAEARKIPVKVLILPKFEIGGMSGDVNGEAEYYYERYLEGGEAYHIPGTTEGRDLYVKDGVALYVTGIGKVNAALAVQAALSDDRFDFTDAYIISTGCAGSAVGYGVMGDVYVITAAVDYDLGHHADIRDMAKSPEGEGAEEDKRTTWFHDSSLDETASVFLNEDLTNRVFDLVKDIPLATTERTREFMRAAFDSADWAVRDPKVLNGTTVSGDNYWKGIYDHENAMLMMKTYGCPDPFACTEMEDVAIGTALKRMGLLDHYLIIRDSVNMDVFMNGETPERLWSADYESDPFQGEDSVEAADIFETAMKNNFEVGSVIIDAILNGEFE